MTNTLTLHDALLRHAIGYDPLSRFAENVRSTPNYPPHNIEQTGQNSYVLTMAVAGFDKTELSVTLERNVLTIEGRKSEPADPADERVLLHQGISFREFARHFNLGEQIEVESIDLANGLLVVSLERHIPEAQKPRRIEIN